MYNGKHPERVPGLHLPFDEYRGPAQAKLRNIGFQPAEADPNSGQPMTPLAFCLHGITAYTRQLSDLCRVPAGVIQAAINDVHKGGQNSVCLEQLMGILASFEAAMDLFVTYSKATDRSISDVLNAGGDDAHKSLRWALERIDSDRCDLATVPFFGVQTVAGFREQMVLHRLALEVQRGEELQTWFKAQGLSPETRMFDVPGFAHFVEEHRTFLAS